MPNIMEKINSFDRAVVIFVRLEKYNFFLEIHKQIIIRIKNALVNVQNFVDVP